jgi:carotenoid cleavage dioxygenase-like enzyme
MTTNLYLADNFAPVPDERTDTTLRVTGTIPRELQGRLLRIGPNPTPGSAGDDYHWFTGAGMVHGVRLRDGRAEWYRRRYVRDDRVCDAFGWPKVPRPENGPNDGPVNTNVIAHAGRILAIVEGSSLPMELTHDLETVRRTDFDGTLGGPFTAHPKRDPATGELHAVVYSWEWDTLRYLAVGTDGRVRRRVDVPVTGRPMVHDCAITATKVLLFDLPVHFDMEMAMGGSSFPYRWHPEYGARVGILPRDGEPGDVRWVEVSTCYVFHPLNAWDLPDGRVVVDVVRHPSMFDNDKAGPNDGPPVLVRWTLDPVSGRATERPHDDRGIEFPRHDERRVGLPIRWGYAANFDHLQHGPAYQYDLETGAVAVHDYGKGRATLEPVFVPRTPDAAENDGYVLSYVYDANTNRSDVVILHAQDFAGDPVATIHLPDRVPFGFHGNWVPDEG